MPFRLLLSAALLLSVAACANWSEDAGVENHWREVDSALWQTGTTSAGDVLDRLGPPSQIVNLKDQVVYYYLQENVSGSGYFFLIYNTSRSTTRYDRAVFFFDNNDLLIRYAYSNEIPPDDET